MTTHGDEGKIVRYSEFPWQHTGMKGRQSATENGGLARRHAVALKTEKPGAKGCLGGIASAGWLEDHQIQSFSREKLFELCKKKRSCFWRFRKRYQEILLPLWGLLTRWHFASFGDCASLKATFRVDTFYELMLYLLWGEVDVKGKKAELTERFVWSCLFLHTYNTPSAFQGCRMRDLLDSEAGGDALSSCCFTSCRRDSRRRSCRHDSRSRSWTSEFWREPKEKLRRLLVEQRRLQRCITWIVKYTALLAIQSSRRPSSCGHCKICPSRGFLPKNQRFWK